MTERGRLAFVVQRYGEDIVGGSEALCRMVAEAVARHRPVDVITSCAKDYVTWKDIYPPGVTTINGVTVRRFRVDFTRDAHFHNLMGTMLHGMPLETFPHHKARFRQVLAEALPQQQRDMLRLQGPYSTPLLDYLATHHADYDLVVFFTYLYPTTVFGAPRVPAAKTILVPTAHDEAVIHLPVLRELFARFPAFVFLTPEERQLVEGLFDTGEALKATIGLPVSLGSAPNAARFRERFGVRAPFLLYAGRLDQSKGSVDLLRYFQAALGAFPPDLSLVLVGDKAIDVPRHPRIRHLGRLADSDKNDALAAATVFVNSSPFESFSIVTLEAMLAGTPVLVNAQSEVLKGHARRSQAGLYYAGYAEFVETVRWLLDNPRLRERMAANGVEYVRRNYESTLINSRYITFFEQAEQTSSGTYP